MSKEVALMLWWPSQMQQLPKPLAYTAGSTAGEPALQQAQRALLENKQDK